jgi:molybdenum cofactor cytidylyltransferase
MTIPIGAIILAAGTSTRMGKAKQLLQINKKAMLEHCIQKCLDFPFQKILVIIGHQANEVKQAIQLKDERVQWIINEDYRKGQSSSFQIAVKEMSKECPSFLVFLGDQPLIRKQTIGRIIQYGNELLQELNSKDPFVIQPFYKEVQGHPVFFGNLEKDALSMVQGDMGAKKLIAQSKRRLELDLNDPFVVFDIDTPDDYVKAIEIYSTIREV